MHLIEVTPQPCMVCGTGNVPTNDGSPRQFLDLERDTFWDDPAILCEECCLKIAGFMGAPSPELIHAAEQRERELKQRVHDLEVELGTIRKRARRLGIEFVENAA